MLLWLNLAVVCWYEFGLVTSTMEKKEINNRNETIINTVTIRDEKELHSQRWNE